MFSFPGCALRNEFEVAVVYTAGFPHSEISGSLVATHLPEAYRSYTASFIAIWCQGIHHLPLRLPGTTTHFVIEPDFFDMSNTWVFYPRKFACYFFVVFDFQATGDPKFGKRDKIGPLSRRADIPKRQPFLRIRPALICVFSNHSDGRYFTLSSLGLSILIFCG